MVNLTYIFLVLQLISYVIINLQLLRDRKAFANNKWIRIYILCVLLVYVFGLTTTFLFNSSFPAFHIGLPLLHYLVLKSLKTDVNYNMIFKALVLISFCIFITETVLLNGWLQNNEVYTIFYNVSIASMSLFIMIKEFTKPNNINNSSIRLFSSLLFFTSSSRLIISLFESSFRQTIKQETYILLFIYFSLEIFQNISLSIYTYRCNKN
jgi:hypothetical protein